MPRPSPEFGLQLRGPAESRRTTPAAREAVIEIAGLRHYYGRREALRGVDLSIAKGELFALLGPNGGGKTTLFRILSTLVAPVEGTVRVLAHDLARDAAHVRHRMGIVFQSPALDGKLTVAENLFHHGRLYGMSRSRIRERMAVLLERLEIAERAGDLVETLSGGLARRTELARALLHGPELLILDEPSTGLDPGARRELGNQLRALRDGEGVTVLLTTHHMEEAERADRVGVLHEGALVAVGAPDELKRMVGGDVVVIQAEEPARLRARVRERFGLEGQLVDGWLRIERSRGHDLVREIVEAFPGEVRSATFGRPTLEDVFVHFTGRRFWENEA